MKTTATTLSAAYERLGRSIMSAKSCPLARENAERVDHLTNVSTCALALKSLLAAGVRKSATAVALIPMAESLIDTATQLVESATPIAGHNAHYA